MNRNLTEGSIFGNIVVFSLPFLLSTFLQTLYGLADLFIIGQFCGVEATTAVSIGSQVMHMLTVMVVGIAMGSTVLIAKNVGAKNEEQKNNAIGNTITFFLILSVVLSIILLVLNNGIVAAMSTPIEAVSGAQRYLFICFIGVPFIIAYNIIASIFRGMGDSKSPMYFVAIACVFNIALDYLFIGFFGLGAAGAALGTTLSQMISVLIAIAAIKKKQMLIGLTLKHLKLKKDIMSNILTVGLPICAQDGFIQISFILITIFANRRGLNDAAAVGVVEKLIGILFLIPSALLSSVSALCAQNIGADEHTRAHRTLLYSIFIASGFGLFFAVLFQFIAPWAVSLFSADTEVIRLGAQYMRSYVWDCIFAGIHFVFSGFFCAYSYSGISFLHNLISILTARIPIAYFASVYYLDTLTPLGWAAPIGSMISVLVCVIAYVVLYKKGKLGQRY